jgi:hypothetical protein
MGAEGLSVQATDVHAERSRIMKIPPIQQPIHPEQAAATQMSKTLKKEAPKPTVKAPEVAKPVPQAPAPKKDAAIISEQAKDLAAQMSGKTAAEEAKESPVVEAREEQGKSGK